MAAAEKNDPVRPIICKCCGENVGPNSNIDSCSCESSTLEHDHVCRIVKHFNDQLNLRAQPPDEECTLSVAIFNVGIRRSDKQGCGKDNEFKAATEMCKRAEQIPFCKAMVIKCSLDHWNIKPDFIILSEAPNNLEQKLDEFLPIYASFHQKVTKSIEDNIFLCWKKAHWKCLSQSIERIALPGFSPRCRIVRLQRIPKNLVHENITLVGVHLDSKISASEKRKIVIRLRKLISQIPNHGVVIIGGDFNLDIHKNPCFPETDEILIPSHVPTAASGCIDNIVVAKFKCQDKMEVIVTGRDVIDIRDNPVLDHNPALAVFSIKRAFCSNPDHAQTATSKSKGSPHEDDNGQGEAEGTNKKDDQLKSEDFDPTVVYKTDCQSALDLKSFGQEFITRFSVQDENCQFHAVTDQLSKFRINKTHTELRANAVEYICNHSTRFSSSETGDFNMNEYVDRMSRDGERGDHKTLKAMGDLYNVNILVISNNASLGPQLMRDRYDSGRPCLCLGQSGAGRELHFVSLQAKVPNTLRSHVTKALGTSPYKSSEPLTDDLGTLDTGPAQPMAYHYPVLINTPFDANFFKENWFFEYSVSRKKLFCFPCRIFYDIAKWPGRKPHYAKDGVADWQNNEKKLLDHAMPNGDAENPKYHTACSEDVERHYRSEKTLHVHTAKYLSLKTAITESKKKGNADFLADDVMKSETAAI